MPADHALIGQSIDAIDTPSLIVDPDILELNLKRLADYFASRPCKIRPHFKSHKCVELARRQLKMGSAVGITCAKLSEAEQLVAGGISDVLIANQVVGPSKAQRLAKLNRRATVRCAVDSMVAVQQLDDAAGEAGVAIGVLVEVDIGMNRCGLPPGEPALGLARQIAATRYLRFDGLQGYEGHAVSKEDRQERESKTRTAMAELTETRALIERSGLPVGIVSGGGTGTYDVTGNLPGIDEVQCGSYALMDWKYKRVRPEFEVSRWILATVISARDNQVVVDVGVKGAGCEFGLPQLADHPAVVARFCAEEHTPFDNFAAPVGERLRLTPSHGCTTANLYRKMWIVRDGVIEDVWPIEGAGCLE
jgi:D-serine deaminase-like pyridoxal phosphate-dependent protein